MLLINITAIIHVVVDAVVVVRLAVAVGQCGLSLLAVDGFEVSGLVGWRVAWFLLVAAVAYSLLLLLLVIVCWLLLLVAACWLLLVG